VNMKVLDDVERGKGWGGGMGVVIVEDKQEE
jgi:hypothetical protein